MIPPAFVPPSCTVSFTLVFTTPYMIYLPIDLEL